MRPKALVLFVVSFFLAAAMTASAQTQARQFRVTAPTANVRLEATTRSKVIGQAHAGDVLTVVSAQGNWVEVSLPSQDGLKREGYVYLSLGSMEFAPAAASTNNDAVPATLEENPALTKKPVKSENPDPKPSEVEPAAKSTPPVRVTRPEKPAKPTEKLVPTSFYGVPHTFGIGGQAGGFTFGFGANVRYWSQGRLGFQVGFSHYGVGYGDPGFNDGISVSANLSVVEISPAVLYRLGDSKPGKTVTIEPFVGGGLNIFRASASGTASGFGQTANDSASSSSMGGAGFFGVEFFFKSMPKLGIGGDVGYYSSGTLGYTSVGGFTTDVSAHWYMK